VYLQPFFVSMFCQHLPLTANNPAASSKWEGTHTISLPVLIVLSEASLIKGKMRLIFSAEKLQ
jgi:hypothetical protein